MRQLAIICLVLCSCGAPRVLNQGAAHPITALSDHDMVAKSESLNLPPGAYARGLHVPGPSPAIYLLDHGDAEYTLAHEIAHNRDSVGGTYADAIRSFTPPNPSPELAAKLEICWQIEAMGADPWRSLFEKYGAKAVNHDDILARLEAKGN